MRKLIERFIGRALAALFSATILVVCLQVIGRYVLETPSSATEEIARFLLIWLGMLSMVYAFVMRMHVGVDLISAKLSASANRNLSRLIWALCAVFALAVLVYGGGRLVNITATLGQSSPALGLPMWTIYTILPISGIIVALYALGFVREGALQDAENPEEMLND